MWKTAIEDALQKTRANMERFGDLFPHVSKNDVYALNPNNDWIDGFWSGILWLCYEYSGNQAFQDAARRTVDSFRQRLEQNIRLDHHDIGFLYSLSSKAQWIIEKDEAAKDLTLQAAKVLFKRWRPKGQYIPGMGTRRR